MMIDPNDWGFFKFQKSKSSAGHRGVQSVIDVLGSDAFYRLRIGIGRPQKNQDPSDYVLKPFSKQELVELNNLVENQMREVIEAWLLE